MANNASEFQEFLKCRKIKAYFRDGEDGGTFCDIYQELECGPNIRTVLFFEKDDSFVNIYFLDYITLDNPLKKEYMYRLFDEFNNKNTYGEYVMDVKNNISVIYSVPFDNNFNCEVLICIIFEIISNMEGQYPAFMGVM